MIIRERDREQRGPNQNFLPRENSQSEASSMEALTGITERGFLANAEPIPLNDLCLSP
jgi:hypothetical protein